MPAVGSLNAPVCSPISWEQQNVARVDVFRNKEMHSVKWLGRLI